MNLNEYATGLGKLVANLNSLEFAIRAFLYKEADGPYNPLLPGLRLDHLASGQMVPVNALTDYDSLRKLLKRYNRVVGTANLQVDVSVADTRDALAHGRISKGPHAKVFRLLKFADPKGGTTTKVTYSQRLTKPWMSSQVKRIARALRRVAKASGATYEASQ